MVNPVSPGVYFQERDNSEYAPTIDSSVAAIVGFASKGPINEATLITSPQQLIDTFGEPNEDIVGQGLEGALEILEATNNIYFVRCADADTATDASATVSLGSCPAVAVSGNSYGLTNPLYLRLQVYNNLGVPQYADPKTFSIPASTVLPTATSACQGMALTKVLGGSLDSNPVGGFYNVDTSTTGFIVGSWAGSGAYLSVSAASGTNFATQGIPVLASLDFSGTASGTYVSSLTVWGASFNSTDISYVAQSLYPGAGYNLGTKSDGSTSGNSVEIDSLGGARVILTVNDKGVAKETYKVSLIENNGFIEDVINTGEDNAVSEIIKGELYFDGAPASPTKLTSFLDKVTGLGSDAVAGTTKARDTGTTLTGNFNARFLKFLESTYSMTGGTNGIATSESDRASDLIGVETGTKTGMQVLNDDVLNISFACVPGITTQSVQNALVTLAEETQNFIAVVAPPYAIGGTQDAIDWHNGQSQTRTAAINSSYAAIYWPWVKVYSVFDAKDRWYDPAIFGIRQMAYTDNVGEPWFAPAGYRRGRLTKPVETEVRLNQGDMDSLYSGGNVINPIMNFVQQGITIFGQRTAQRNPTALDRLNVRRLAIYIKKVATAACRQFVFEPNDEYLWVQIENVLNPLMDDIQRRRGITEFKVVCDETVNTPARVDRNEVWVKLLVKPTKAAEIIIIELNLTNQSAQIN